MAKIINSFSIYLKASSLDEVDPDNWVVERVGTDHTVGDSVATGAVYPKTGNSTPEVLSGAQKGAKDIAGTLLKVVQDCKASCETTEGLPSGNKEIQQMTTFYWVDCSDVDADNWSVRRVQCDHLVGDSGVAGVRYPSVGSCPNALLSASEMGAKDVAGNLLKYMQDTKSALEAVEGI